MASVADWVEAPDLKELAERVIGARENISHVDVGEVLFLWENETKPKNQGLSILARCYSLKDHPIGLFTGARFAVVFYRQQMDWMNDRQRAILMWHELQHIPEKGDKLVNHDVQEFYAVLKEAGLDWGNPHKEVPDILG